MIIKNNFTKASNFKLVINHNIIPQTNSVKYLGVTLDNTLSWQSHIDKISNKFQECVDCGMAFNLKHYVPLSTLKLMYYSMFNLILQYFLINWSRAPKCYLQKIKTIQNRFLRASLFRK